MCFQAFLRITIPIRCQDKIQYEVQQELMDKLQSGFQAKNLQPIVDDLYDHSIIGTKAEALWTTLSTQIDRLEELIKVLFVPQVADSS